MEIGGKIFNTKNKTYIMGILNLTPDSFHDGGRFNTLDLALKQAEKLIMEGADILDIGAQSTRPGHAPISRLQELTRLDKIVSIIKRKFDIPISVDTFDSEVAKVVLNQGADLINDVSNLSDIDMAKTVADFNATYCLTHNVVATNRESCNFDFFNTLKLELKNKTKLLTELGVAKDKIIVDPGIGFNKSFDENLTILKNLDKLVKLNFPVLIGASNKSFLGTILNQKQTSMRLNGTIAVSTLSAFAGVSFVRVHEVFENKQAIDVAMAIKNSA